MFIKTAVGNLEEIKFCKKCKKPLSECTCEKENDKILVDKEKNDVYKDSTTRH